MAKMGTVKPMMFELKNYILVFLFFVLWCSLPLLNVYSDDPFLPSSSKEFSLKEMNDDDVNAEANSFLMDSTRNLKSLEEEKKKGTEEEDKVFLYTNKKNNKGKTNDEEDFENSAEEKLQAKSFMASDGIEKNEIKDTSVNQEEYIKSLDGHLPVNLSSNDFDKVLHDIKTHSHSDFSFKYYKDSFSYKNTNKNFDRTYRDSPDSSYPSMLQIGGGRIYPTMLGHLGLGFNLGLSYSSGNGYFKNDGEKAEDMTWKFYTIPFDIRFSYDLPLFSILKLGASAGPSLIGLIQNRSDLEDNGDGRKRIRRWGYGYFYSIDLKIELLQWFSDDYIRKVFNQYSMTNTFLTFSVRGQNYTHFSRSQSKPPQKSNTRENLEISGRSYGIGLTYEFY